MSGKKIIPKKNHHYVWSHYLRRWSENGAKVWRTTETGRIDLQDTKAFAKEDHFYRAQPINGDQIYLIDCLFRNASGRVRTEQVEILSEIVAIQKREKAISQLGIDEEAILNYVNAMKSNILEDRHATHENATRPVLDALVNGDLKVLEDDQKFSDFIKFFAHQLTRTKAFREKLFVGNTSWVQEGDGSELVYENIRKCDWLLGYMIGIQLADSLLSTRRDDKHCLIKNETEELFITSDQPVINVHPSVLPNSGKLPADDECDLFFPVSPTTAYMINASSKFSEGVSSATLDMVRDVNERIALSSHCYIVGNCKDIIKRYKKFVSKK